MVMASQRKEESRLCEERDKGDMGEQASVNSQVPKFPVHGKTSPV